MGRIHAARILVNSLPDQLTASNSDGELLGYVKFFGVWDAVPLLAELAARDPGENGTKAEKKAWEKEYKVCLSLHSADATLDLCGFGL